MRQSRSALRLDGLRGIAALCVVFVHCGLIWFSFDVQLAWTPDPPRRWWLYQLPILRLVVSGLAPVSVFFVVSGYTISHHFLTLVRRGEFEKAGSAIASSVFRRHTRLFLPPAVVGFVTLMMGYFNLFPDKGLPGVAYPTRVLPHFDSLWGQLQYYIHAEVLTTDPIGQPVVRADSEDPEPLLDPHLWTIPIEFMSSMVVFMFLSAFTRVHNKVRMLFALCLAIYLQLVFVYWGMFLFLSATDSNNDHASLSIEGGERSVSGDDRSIEAISPYVLEWENDEDEEIKETISHDDHDGLDHSGDESGREGSGSPPALGNARPSNADETIGRPLSSALVPDSHIDIHVSRRRSEIPSRLQSPVRYVGDSRSRNRGRSHRRGYVPPISADRDDNDAQLAETLPFDLKDEKLIEDARRSTGNTGSTLQAWFKKRASFGDGIDTELVVINAAESFTDEKAKSIVTLYCQKDALDHVEPTPRQIYWLHVRHSSDVLKVIRSLVICCPFIHTGYQSLALGLLERVSPHDQNFSRNATLSDQEARTNVSRVDGVHAGHPLLRDSVTYYSTPYLVFREGQRKMGHDDMESLLSAHYGYDVGDARDKMQVLSETQNWLDKEILHVARMKGLLIGPEVLLTWGEVPLSAICKDNIIFDESNSRPLVTVRITDFHSKEYYSYIKHDFSFAELIARITHLTSLEDFDIIEDSYDGAHVNSELWAIIHYLRDSEYFAPPPPPPPPPPDFDRSRVVHIDYNNRSTSRTQIQRHKYAPQAPGLNLNSIDITKEPPRYMHYPNPPTEYVSYNGGSGGEQKEEGSMSTMVRLLRKIDGSLRESILYGRVYKSGYECSFEDICNRHDILSVLGSESATGKATTDDYEESDEGSASKKSTQNPSPDSPRSTGDSEKKQGGLYVNTTEQANELIRDVFTISKTILGLYLPLKDDGARFYADIKGVIDRFWGALDLIFRHIRFAALMTAAEGEQSWIIRGSCYNHAKSPMDGICDACESKKEYDLIGALEHLHARSGHTQSPDHQVPAAPHEDPCIVWLQNAKTAERDRLFNTLIEDLTVFKGDLRRILDVSRELHLFIARPGNRPEEGFNEHVGNRGTANDKEGGPGIGTETREKANDHSGSPHEARGDQQTQEQKRSINQTEAPALPTSLLRAFENIVALFSVQARIVLLTSRENESKGRRNNRVYKGKTRYISTLDEVITCIESAREDLILGITAENTSSVRLGAVGAEYIVAMAMANVQTGAFRIGAGSSKVPLSFAGFGGEVRRGTRRRAVTWTEDLEVPDAVSQRPGHKVAAPTTSLDLIALYAAHARALDFNASLRPKRRAFLAIRALEEELQALKDLNVTQWHCLDNSKRVSDPISFRVVDRERKARFPLERKVIERAKAERRREHDELIAMLHRAADLRARVKESIEVLDEGHGNAIRIIRHELLWNEYRGYSRHATELMDVLGNSCTDYAIGIVFGVFIRVQMGDYYEACDPKDMAR
ncbi:hypothetical protein CcaCcLH18_06101 [Colletotrichum camelliae]|nr:hypothetical protein CcaCcLH18_06101 [Colletotrichum camelliae]